MCIQQLHVVFAIDRAGLVGSDGETHQGIFDLSFLNCIPNMTIFAPKDGEELKLNPGKTWVTVFEKNDNLRELYKKWNNHELE